MDGNQPSILLVDDVEANLLALEALLSNLGCNLVRARSGNEALRQLLKQEFAVMLLDVQMPEMDGYEVAKYAREHPTTREVPIIFVTASHETEESVLRAYDTGAVDFLFKPINPYVLRSKVRIFLELFLSRRKLADEIQAHKETLAELEAFTYSVSHDLRAPLRPLDGFSQVLLEDYSDQLLPEAKDYLQRIRAAAQRMSQLIDDLLRLSRVSRAEVAQRPVNLATMADSIISELRTTEPSRDVKFVAEPDARVTGDPRLLRIALENLLRNAWKFTRKQPQGRIEFGTRRENGSTVCYVRDNGAGFDPHYAGKIFQPFQRFHKASEFEGTGIGLAIVHRIIRRHGGRIWAEGAPDEGATFFFSVDSATNEKRPAEDPHASAFH